MNNAHTETPPLRAAAAMLPVIAGLAMCVALIACPQTRTSDKPIPNLDLNRGPEFLTVTNSIGMKLNLIQPGEFLMGAPDSDPDATPDERPQHRVRIPRAFYMGVYEVTQSEFERVMNRKSSFYSPTGPGADLIRHLDADRLPAEQVTWELAVEFCRRLSSLSEEEAAGRRYRLPSEAEWEYACRAGSTTRFANGDSLSSREANFNGEYPLGDAQSGPFLAHTTEVGTFAPNAFGLYDMHGNVTEWCSDRYDRNYYQVSPTENPQGPTTGTSRVIRGGNWYSDARDCRSSFRYADIPDGTFYVMGFRVVMEFGEASVESPPQGTMAAVDAGSKEPGRKQLVHAPVPDSAADDSLATGGEDWPRWRGPRGNGTWHGPQLADKWPGDGLEHVWSQPVGGGYGGVAATAGRVLVMDRQIEAADVERVLCFGQKSGELIWEHKYEVDYADVSYGNGPRSTPTVYDGRVYTLGAVGNLFCLDLVSGQVVWARDLVPETGATIPIWGLSASPIVVDDLLVVHPGIESGGSVMAVDRLTGKEVWRAIPEQAGYATPIVIESGGERQLVAWTPKSVNGLEITTGQRLWTVPFEVTYSTSIATPIFEEGLVLVSGYYEGAKVIRPGVGDSPAELVWQDRRNLRGLMSQPLYRNGHAFLLDKRHGLTCFELSTGKKLWDDGNQMTPKGRNPQATMVWLGDESRVIVLNSDGELILARLNADGYHEQSRTRIIGTTWAHPAYAGDVVFARSDEELVAVRLPTKRAGP